MTTAKSGRQLSLSAASTGGYKRFAKCVLIAADKCPPAENPSTPILCGSICHSAARKRTRPTVLCASSRAMGDSGYGPDFGYGPTSVTRYFNSTHADPLGRQPITDLRAFKIDGQTLIAPTREDDDRRAGILSFWRVNRHRRP